METEGSDVNNSKNVDCDSVVNSKSRIGFDEVKYVDVSEDRCMEIKIKGSNENANEDLHCDSAQSKSSDSDRLYQTNSNLNGGITISSSEDEVTSFGPRTGGNGLEVDAGIDLGISSRTRLKMGFCKMPTEVNENMSFGDSDNSLTSSNADDDDEDFEANNYNSSVSMESISLEGNEEDNEVREVDEDESKGIDNEEQSHDEQVSNRGRFSCIRSQTFSGIKNMMEIGEENNNNLDGAYDGNEIRKTKVNNDGTYKKECEKDMVSGKEEELRKSTNMKETSAFENCEIGARVVKPSFNNRGWSGKKKQKKLGSSTWTYDGKGDNESNGIHKGNGECNDKFNGDDNNKVDLWEVKVCGKEWESRESTKTKQASADENTDIGMRVAKPPTEKSDCSSTKDLKKLDSTTVPYEEEKVDNKFNAAPNENGQTADNFNGDGTYKERFSEDKESKKHKEMDEATKRKIFYGPRNYDFLRILVDSILDKGEALEGGATEQEAKQSSLIEYTLPLKFKFEDEEPKPEEKSELDKMADELFAEMEFALKSKEMGSFDPPAVGNENKNVSEVQTNQTNLCHQVKHHLVLDEQIGLRCCHCSYVDLEIRHITPPLLKRKYSAGALERNKVSGDEDFSMFNGLEFQASGDNSQEPFNHNKGTVWDIIPGVRESMYSHQQEGFEFLWKNMAGSIDLAELKSSNSSGVGGCIISHAPGTGKTRLTIVFIEAYLKLFPYFLPVIIAPASMLLTWEEEFRKWNVEFPFHNLNNLEFSGKENKTALKFLPESKRQDKDAVRMLKIYSWRKDKSILGVSYNLYKILAGEKFIKDKGKKKQKKVFLDKDAEQLRKILLELPDLVVLDEGHTPRNQRSHIWNTLLKLQTKRRIILSGTPFQNSFGELFNTLRLVRPEIADVLAKGKAFADMIPSRTGKCCRKKLRETAASHPSSGGKVDDAIEKLKATIAPFVHVHKGSILQESLPGLRDCVVLLNPPQLQKNLIESIEGSQNTFNFEHKVALVSVHPSLFLWCSLSDKEKSIIDQDTLEQIRLNPNEGVKTRFIMALISFSAAMNEKVLIFSQYIHPLGLIKDQIKKKFGWDEGKEVFQMQGQLDQKHRQNLINIFNDPKTEAKVLLASTKCCSEGINLVGASRVVLLDVVWNPSVERQAISRAYRLGQVKVVYTYHLMTSGTTESDKYCRQAEKDRLSELVFSSTTKESDKQKAPAAVFSDKILEEMVGHEKFKDMFEKIIYQPKETNLIESFGLASHS
ncbi:hypothetical protein F0562_018576 [Nyssa sinensis]|uniref:Uncharacterized protein n=1 Tax=Nyssa sinensis TaxID=561372 RepID=A0A5J4ZAI4_9ASTE|nr:hypothetical protein F0562_018576 [Nyssa sinensis]